MHITLFKQLQGTAFNQAMLMQELDKQTVHIPAIFSLEFAKRTLISRHMPIDKDNALDLLYALGSYRGQS